MKLWGRTKKGDQGKHEKTILEIKWGKGLAWVGTRNIVTDRESWRGVYMHVVLLYCECNITAYVMGQFSPPNILGNKHTYILRVNFIGNIKV